MSETTCINDYDQSLKEETWVVITLSLPKLRLNRESRSEHAGVGREAAVISEITMEKDDFR